MPQSLAQILIHLVFSTKNREPFIAFELQGELFSYLAGALKNIGCPPVQIGGMEDHVHLLFGLSRTRTVAYVVETIKTSSSKWIKTHGEGYHEFFWQAGYGAFSVSQSEAARVDQYIRDQARHHAARSFQDEFRALLKRHGVDFDEKYVWD